MYKRVWQAHVCSFYRFTRPFAERTQKEVKPIRRRFTALCVLSVSWRVLGPEKITVSLNSFGQPLPQQLAIDKSSCLRKRNGLLRIRFGFVVIVVIIRRA